MRNPLWPKEKDNALRKWSHHQPLTHTLEKNKPKALNQVIKIKGKINLKMMVMHQMMPKIKITTPSKLKIKGNLMIKSKANTMMV